MPVPVLMTVTVASVMTAFFGSVMRPVSEALVDWQRRAVDNRRTKNIVGDHLARGDHEFSATLLHHIAFAVTAKRKANTGEVRGEKSTAVRSIKYDTPPLAQLYHLFENILLVP